MQTNESTEEEKNKKKRKDREKGGRYESYIAITVGNKKYGSLAQLDTEVL